MQPVPGLVGAGQAMQRGALLRGKDAAAAGSWGKGWQQTVRPGGQGGAHTGRCPTPGPEEMRGDSLPGVPVALMHARARVRGEQVAGSLTPKALLPRLPRPPKVLDLLKGSVGATSTQEFLCAPGPPPPRGFRTWQVPPAQSEGALVLGGSAQASQTAQTSGTPTCQVTSGQEAARMR